MANKLQMRERLPTPSSDDEASPKNCVDKCPILNGKNINLTSFTFDAHSFHIENYFVSMDWVSIVTLDEKVYPNLMKESYQDMTYSLGLSITCMVLISKGRIPSKLVVESPANLLRMP
ncbi:hypothetical protein Adt_04810 [Abeliophyllum distichum]|uniref:Uncharacterized protein n=1 Tax=Abeliophyllum distichum TaxID=126358 RepID=A0ABD1V2B3_9LAMI